MKIHSLNTAFDLGFWIGILLFIGVNVYGFNENPARLDDISFGIPFSIQDGGYLFEDVIWLGLFGDILFAIFFSLILGLVFKFVWSKIFPPHLL